MNNLFNLDHVTGCPHSKLLKCHIYIIIKVSHGVNYTNENPNNITNTMTWKGWGKVYCEVGMCISWGSWDKIRNRAIEAWFQARCWKQLWWAMKGVGGLWEKR